MFVNYMTKSFFSKMKTIFENLITKDNNNKKKINFIK